MLRGQHAKAAQYVLKIQAGSVHLDFYFTRTRFHPLTRSQSQSIELPQRGHVDLKILRPRQEWETIWSSNASCRRYTAGLYFLEQIVLHYYQFLTCFVTDEYLEICSRFPTQQIVMLFDVAANSLRQRTKDPHRAMRKGNINARGLEREKCRQIHHARMQRMIR